MSKHQTPLWQAIRNTYDPDDPWGSALDWQVAVAEALHRSGGDVPASWQYRPSPMHRVGQPPDEDVYDAREVWDLLTAGEVTAEDLRAAGEVLARHAARAAAAGHDY